MKLEIKNLLGNSFDTMYDVEPSMMICTPALDPTEPIQGYTDLTLNAKLNAVSELNLCVHKVTEDGELNPCYGLVEKRKYIYMEGVGYFRITDCSEENSGDDDIKKIITAESKEAELGNINVPDLGTTNYELQLTTYTLKLYDADNDEEEATNLKDCIIKRIESALIGWHFDLSLLDKTKARAQSAYTFGTSDGGQESIGENIYNFLTTTVADAFEVIFLFNTLNSKIIPIYRDQYYNKTSLFFDRENIVESSRRNEKEGTFCTCLELSPNEDLIPYLNKVNPTGKYLYNFSYYLNNNGWMDQNLKDSIEIWENTIKNGGVSSSDPQLYRCFEAWRALRTMNEKGQKNIDLYQIQHDALSAAINTPNDDTDAAINNMSNLNSTVLNQAGIKRDDGTSVSVSSIEQGMKNIGALRTLSSALSGNINYRSYFKELDHTFSVDDSTQYYNIISNENSGKLTECDRLIFKFRCTALPTIQIDSSNETIPVKISLSINGMSFTDTEPFLVTKIKEGGAEVIDTSDIEIVNRNGEKVTLIKNPNEINEYYKIEWVIGAIKVGNSYVPTVDIYGNNHDPNTPYVKLTFAKDTTSSLEETDFVISEASFEANVNDYYTYVNSDFVMDSTMYKTENNNNIYGYHIWTPAFLIYNNVINPTCIESEETEPFKKTDIISDIGNISYMIDSEDSISNLNPCLVVNFNPIVPDTIDPAPPNPPGDIKKSDITTASWNYTPFPEDFSENSDEVDSLITVTGYEIRLHFYGEVEINGTWVRKKLSVKSSPDAVDYDANYITYGSPTIPMGNIPFTFKSILNFNLPKIGKFSNTDVTPQEDFYTEVKYMRIEVFTGNINIFNTLTIYDPVLAYNATNADLFSFNKGVLYPENYFDGVTEDPSGNRSILRPPYSKVFPYITTLEYTNDNIVVLDTDDMAKREELALEFITEAKKQFKQNTTPVMECTIDSGAEIFSRDYTPIRNELALGSFCQVEFDTDDYSELPLEEISINWQECNFSMTFGTFRKKGSRWADLISQTISNQKSMDVKTTKLYSYVLDDTLGSVSEALATGKINASALKMISGNETLTKGYEITDNGATFVSEDSAKNKYVVSIADGSIACSKINANNTIETTTALGKYVVGGQTQWGLYGGAIIAHTITADKIQVGAIGGWTIDPKEMFHSTLPSANGTKYIDALISAGGVSSTPGIEGYSIPTTGINTSEKKWKLLFGETALDTNQKPTNVNYTFGVDSTGKLYARGADIQGHLEATSGSFTGTITVSGSNSSLGGWTVTPSLMEHKSGNITDGYINPGGGTVSNTVQGGVNNGSISWNLLLGTGQKFGVTSTGVLWANGANINGTITSDIGSIGGWTIAPDGIKFSSAIALKSDGIIGNGSSNVDRTLIGNFVCGNQQTPYIQMPNGINSHDDSNEWAFLTGTNNTFRFGITSSGNVIMNGLFFSQARKDNQYQVISPTFDARCQIYIGNIVGGSEGITFPTTTVDNWLMLAGYNNNLRFGIAYDGTLTTNLSSRCTLGGENLEDWIDGKQDTLTQGTNISINGSVISATDTTYDIATPTTSQGPGTAGLMSADDKAKLNGIATGANKYELPMAGSGTLGGVKINGNNLSINQYGVLSATDTTYSLAEASSSGVGGTNGLMSASDKEKLDELTNGLNTTTLTPRGSAGFDKLAPYRVIKFGPFGIIHIYMRRTETNNPYDSGTYAYFASDLPVGFRPSTEQILTIYDVEGQQFNIKVPAKSASNPDYLWIARIGGKMGENVPHTIQCDIWYEID